MSDKIMIVSAHPDDAEIAMGGTIAKCINENKNIMLVDITNGEPTPHGDPATRQTEWERSSKILGIKNRINLNLPNREVVDSISNRKALANIIRDFKPDILFAPYWEDAHPDHLAVSNLVVAARFYSEIVKWDLLHSPHYPGKVFYYFSTHLRVQFKPSFIFDISDFWDVKLESLKAYHSQFVANPVNQQVFEQVKIFNSYWGQQAGVKYGEPFVCREQISLRHSDALLSA